MSGTVDRGSAPYAHPRDAQTPEVYGQGELGSLLNE